MWMKFSLLQIALVAVSTPAAVIAQTGPDIQRAASAVAGSQGMEALQRASTSNKYLFVFFWREEGQQTGEAWAVLQGAMSKVTEKADFISINVSNPSEKPVVTKFGADRSPLPLVLAIAPNGAVTRGFPRKFNESQLLTAFVTPGTATCLKALQSRKLVLLAIQSRSPYVPISLQKGVSDFAADPRYAGATQIVVLDPADPAEAPFFKDLKVDAGTGSPTTVLLAPPGSVVAKFTGIVTKEQIVAKLASAQSGYCPGGKCGPGGCGPKK